MLYVLSLLYYMHETAKFTHDNSSSEKTLGQLAIKLWNIPTEKVLEIIAVLLLCDFRIAYTNCVNV